MAALVDEEIGKIAREGVTPRELARSLNSRRASFLDQIASVLGKADRLASYDYNAGTPDYVQQDLARYERVTAADVQRVAASVPQPTQGGAHRGARGKATAHGHRRCQVSAPHSCARTARHRRGGRRRRVLAACSGPRVVTTPPPTPVAVAAPAAAAPVDLTKPPTLGAPPSLRPPQISDARALERAEDRGRRAARAAARRLRPPGPLGRRERIRPARRAPPRSSPPCSPKARRRAPRCRSPTRRRSSACQLNATSGWEQSNVSLHTPTAQLDSALALFADVALRPSFPATELERVRKVRLTALQQLRDRAPAIADRAFASAVFGEQHPYGRPLAGTEGSRRGHHARRRAALLRDVLPAEQRDAARRRRREAGRRGAPGARAVRRLGTRDRPDAGDQHAERREGHDGRARRQAGRGAVVVPHRRRRRAALDQRLLPAAGDEHDAGRVVHEPAQPEPARDARLHVRRGLGLRTAALGRPVHRERRGRDGQDGLGADRVHEGAARRSAIRFRRTSSRRRSGTCSSGCRAASRRREGSRPSSSR